MNNPGKSELCGAHPSESMLMENEAAQDGPRGHVMVMWLFPVIDTHSLRQAPHTAPYLPVA